jgi:DNA-directed RNA polymerase subunit M
MNFCKCGGLMLPKNVKGKLVLECRKCRSRQKAKGRGFKLKERIGHERGEIVVVDQELEVLPKTRQSCPRCEHPYAFWWLQQTRSGDEPPTRFLRCVECGYRWREYD